MCPAGTRPGCASKERAPSLQTAGFASASVSVETVTEAWLWSWHIPKPTTEKKKECRER